MKKIVVLSGAGVSAESGLKTFRDSGGLWESYTIADVATPEAWNKDPKLVLKFYNERRKQAAEASPNEGHLALVKLESFFLVRIITQNVDNLHEKAGSKNVMHLHGELSKVRSEKSPDLIKDIGNQEIKIGDLAEDGAQLRPHIVWFGEMVPMIEPAVDWILNADILIVVGTSLQVYPAAGLVEYASNDIPKFLVDPVKPSCSLNGFEYIQESAAVGLPTLVDKIIHKYS
jgi:NAD-dependent deacetylase